jgi:hypothetical protein
LVAPPLAGSFRVPEKFKKAGEIPALQKTIATPEQREERASAGELAMRQFSARSQ